MSTFLPERRCKSTNFLRSLQIFGEFFSYFERFSFRSVHHVVGSGVLIGVLHDVRFAGSDERKRDFEGRSALFVTGCVQLGAEMQAFGICTAESDAAENLILGAVGREIGFRERILHRRSAVANDAHGDAVVEIGVAETILDARQRIVGCADNVEMILVAVVLGIGLHGACFVTAGAVFYGKGDLGGIGRGA